MLSYRIDRINSILLCTLGITKNKHFHQQQGNKKEKIGFVGLGSMTAPVATRLLKAGYRPVVFNRTKQKANSLISQGAMWCNSPALMASKAENVFSMISTPNALEKISLGRNSILSGFEQGGIHNGTAMIERNFDPKFFIDTFSKISISYSI